MSATEVYQELGTSPPFIRLFALLPSPSPDAPLEGHLQAYPLDSCPPYEALSYAWGAEGGLTKPIRLDSGTVLATPNLDSALRSLRREDAQRVLWVDALCINQKSAPERSHQVSLMRDIYSRCERDILWLGPDLYSETGHINPSEEELAEGMELMARIAEKDIAALEVMEGHWNKYHDRIGPFLRRYHEKNGRKPGHRNEEPGSNKLLLDSKEQYALEKVMTYAGVWRRVWVMQELSLAPKIQLVAGRHTLDWDLISGFLGDTPYADAFHGHFSHGSVHAMVGTIFSKVQSVNHQRRLLDDVRSGKAESTMLDVLARFRASNATDPRDKVYGVLGLATDSLRDRIKPDYSKEPWEVYAEVTAAIINHNENLDIICQSPWRPFHSNSGKPLDGLPSWAADFRIDGTVHLFAHRSIFNAGRHNCQVPCRVLDASVLVTKGVKIGRIGKMLQRDYYRRDGDDIVPRWQNEQDLPLDWLLLYLGKDILEKPSPEQIYINGESALTAFWRTLITDCEGFPMKRLTQEQVEEYDTIVRKEWLETLQTRQQHVKDGQEKKAPYPSRALERMRQRLYSEWSFSITDNGLYTLIVPPAREGDVLACLDGGKVPAVLRPVEHDGAGQRWQLVTVAYVHGFMDGEATESKVLAEKLGLAEEDIWLV